MLLNRVHTGCTRRHTRHSLSIKKSPKNPNLKHFWMEFYCEQQMRRKKNNQLSAPTCLQIISTHKQATKDSRLYFRNKIKNTGIKQEKKCSLFFLKKTWNSRFFYFFFWKIESDQKCVSNLSTNPFKHFFCLFFHLFGITKRNNIYY